jgi:membrane-associated protease RseP (regulator of RpoE activity)
MKPANEPDIPAGEAAPPLTPAAWLMSNGPWLLIFGIIIGLIWYKLGLESVWSVAKVAFGLGVVIFIHELGHFLAAKWNDVHVQTFSIGFGPALPGCSFQRGETTYKIGAIPLGGYVNMVGEGPEADEDEDYPRSFKNKTVGQRMVIISAGVVMNVLLGCVLFIVVYYYHGVEVPPAIVGRVDPGSPMWKQGIPTGSLITQLDGIRNPVFKNLQRKVVLSSAGEKIPFTFQMYGPDGQKEGERTVDLEPRLEENDPNPLVGVSPPNQLRLPPRPKKDLDVLPVARFSPAASARPVPVGPDEVLVAATDPDNPDKVTEIKHDLLTGAFDYLDFSKRLRLLEGKKLVVRVQPKRLPVLASDLIGLMGCPLGQGPLLSAPALVRITAGPVQREVPAEGFQFNDKIVGCTVAQNTRDGLYNPFLVGDLPRDPRHASGDRRDPFVFHARMNQLAGLPMVVRVRRGDPNSSSLRDDGPPGPTVDLLVPPAFHATFGLRMKMGRVAGIRDDSPLSRARDEKDPQIKLQKEDELTEVVLTDERGSELFSSKDLDPERLPYQLRQAAASRPGKKNVILTFRRGGAAPDHRLTPIEWQDRWDNDDEMPLSLSSPLAIPQLGLAYWVLSQVVEVTKDSPAADAGLKSGDTIKGISFWGPSEFSKEPDWDKETSLESKRNGNSLYDCWAQVFWVVQRSDYKKVRVKVNRPGDEKFKDAIELTAREDASWPLVPRGIRLIHDYREQKANNFGEALVMGGRESYEMIGLMYLQLRSLATGRVSYKQVGGPIAMLSAGFSVAQAGNFELLLLLAAISINLAVVNFLPIPILDGGHMVFLIYEKLRGRPPSESVRIVATYIGLAVIGLLMIFVFYQDFQNYVRGWFKI